ncbi:MAG: aspartate aminotransferase family protein [Tepidisphaerales bacterium]
MTPTTTTTTAEIVAQAKQVLIGNYARLPVVMQRGEGCWVWDTDGRKYLDLFAGFGGCVLGHCHPELIDAATEQAKTLWHVGNTFYTLPQIRLGEHLRKHAFDGRAFFCHSGLEANEAAVKLARLHGARWAQEHGGPKKWQVISLHRSFHGRSLAMVAATGNPAVKAGFEPQVPGFTQVELGDLEGLVAAVTPETASIMVEPIQGEGGIHIVPNEYARELRKLCDAHGILLHFDEVWTGCGRTGRWFGHQHLVQADGTVIRPDIMTLGKAIGGGLPVGVMWARPELAELLVPGKHGCTLGANGICMAVAAKVFDVIERDDLVTHARVLGEHAIARLKNTKSIAAKVAGVRGKGLFLGVEFKEEPKDFVLKGLEKGVILNLTQKTVCRIAPPINISRDEWDLGLDRLIGVIESL